MAADMHLHIWTDDISDDDMAIFFSSTLGSKYFDPGKSHLKDGLDLYEKFYDTPNIWIGEVSWLKASLFEDEKTYVPDLVDFVHSFFENDDEFKYIDDDFIEQVKNYPGSPEHPYYATTQAERVAEFLEHHKGERAFLISW